MGDQAQTRRRHLTGLVSADQYVDRRAPRARGIARSTVDGRGRASGHPQNLRLRLLRGSMSR